MIKNQTQLSPEQIAAEIEYLHTAVDLFHNQMKVRLEQKVRENRTGWNDPELAKAIYEDLLAHAAGVPLAAGHEIDIANFAMFLWWQRLEREGTSK